MNPGWHEDFEDESTPIEVFEDDRTEAEREPPREVLIIVTGSNEEYIAFWYGMPFNATGSTREEAETNFLKVYGSYFETNDISVEFITLAEYIDRERAEESASAAAKVRKWFANQYDMTWDGVVP